MMSDVEDICTYINYNPYRPAEKTQLQNEIKKQRNTQPGIDNTKKAEKKYKNENL
jgi:hypothetical protein